MTILVTSDWHLNNKSRDRYRHNWVRDELPSLISGYDVTTLVMLGDLTDEFDNHPASLVNEVVEHLTRLSTSFCRVCGGSGFSGRGTGYDDVCGECGGNDRIRPIQIYLMRGNHDYVDPSCPFFGFTAALPNVTWINTPRKILRQQGLSTALFLPHTRDYKADWADVDFNGVDICFAHNTFDGTVSESGRELSGVPPSAIPAHIPVISGDIHKRQKVGHITYVGSPYTIDFGDDFKPRVLVLTDDKTRSVACRGPQKKLVTVSEGGPSSAQQLHEAMTQAAEAGDIVKLRITVGKHERENWPTIKRSITEEAIKMGVRLHSIEAVSSSPQPTAAKRYRSTGKVERAEDILKAYCTSRGIDGDTFNAGLEIIAAKE